MPLLPKNEGLGWTPYAWLIYLVPFAITPGWQSRSQPADWLLYLSASAVFIALYLRGYWARDREMILIVIAMVALGIAFWPASYGAGAFFIYAAAHAAHLSSANRAMRTIAAITLVAAAMGLATGHRWPHLTWPIVFTALVGGVNLHFAQQSRANARLSLAHDEIEHLAKVAERERIARDLHDLLGHTLSVIILKAELASKLHERDPERARNEIREVEHISRDALAQVRSAVRGYRAGGLLTELDAAHRTLETAGVTFSTDIEKITLPPTHEVVLALAVRESVTNVVRHAAATHCNVTLKRHKDTVVVTISDDGRGSAAPFGSGLNGMRERLQSLGGKLHRRIDRGTTLTMTLPYSNVTEHPSAIGESA